MTAEVAEANFGGEEVKAESVKKKVEVVKVLPQVPSVRPTALVVDRKCGWFVDELAGRRFEFVDARAKDDRLWAIGDFPRLARFSSPARAAAERSAWWLRG